MSCFAQASWVDAEYPSQELENKAPTRAVRLAPSNQGKYSVRSSDQAQPNQLPVKPEGRLIVAG